MKASEFRNLTSAEIEQKLLDLKKNFLTSVFNWLLVNWITRLKFVMCAKRSLVPKPFCVKENLGLV